MKCCDNTFVYSIDMADPNYCDTCGQGCSYIHQYCAKCRKPQGIICLESLGSDPIEFTTIEQLFNLESLQREGEKE